MTRALPRTNFNSSRLVRFLASQSLVDADPPPQAFAEGLGQWLGFADAITLHAALGSGAASRGGPRNGCAADAATRKFAAARTAMVDAIARSCSPGQAETRLRLPLPGPGASVESASDYEPYLRFHQAQQREMEAGVRRLRSAVRDELGRGSAALAQLATLDAAFERILAERERRLLGNLPSRLERRFNELFEAHRNRRGTRPEPDDPGQWLLDDGWLARFCSELHEALQAELDLRLQAVAGLIEALSEEAGQQA